MNNILEKIVNIWNLFPQWTHQFVRFLLVGISNTLLSFFILWLFDTFTARDIWCYPITYFIVITNSFLLNKIFTFKQKRFTRMTTLQYILFLLFGIFLGSVYSITAIVLEVIFGFHYIIASFGGTMLHFLIQFIIVKFIIFKMYVKNNE